MRKPILCVDFDGVIHLYSSGWQGVDVIPDGPVPGAMNFLAAAQAFFDVVIYSSRSKSEDGWQAMNAAVDRWLHDALPEAEADMVFADLDFAHEKPAAFLTIDDRAVCFTGTFPSVSDLLAFKPWNKKGG